MAEKEWDRIAATANLLIDQGKSADEVRDYLSSMGTTEEELRSQRAKTAPPAPNLYEGPSTEIARSTLRGASFGLSDPVEAWLRSKTTGGTYEQNKEALKQASEQLPFTQRIGGELAGGALTGFGMLRAIPALGRAMKTTDAMKRDAALGAGGGAIQGSVSDDMSATEGATYGTLGGALLTPVLKGGKAGYDYLHRTFSPNEAKRLAAQRGENLVAERLALDSLGRRTMLSRAAEFSDPMQVNLVDIAGPNSSIAGLTREAMSGPFFGRKDIQDRLAQRTKEMKEEMPSSILKASGTSEEGAASARDQLLTDIKSVSEPAYKQAYLEGNRPVDTPEVLEFFNKKWVQQDFLPDALAKLDSVGVKMPFSYKVEKYKDFMGDERTRIIPTSAVNIEAFDLLKRYAQGFISDAFKAQPGAGSGKKHIAHYYKEDLEKALAGLDKDPRFSSYSFARKEYGDEAARLSAFNEAETFMSDSAADVKFKLKNFESEAEKKVYKDSAINQIVLDLRRKNIDSNTPYKKMEGVDEVKDKLAVLLGSKKDAETLLSRVEQLNTSAATERVIGRGAPKEIGMADQVTFGNASRSAAGAPLATGNVKPLYQQSVGEALLNRSKLPVPQTMSQIATEATIEGIPAMESVFKRIAQLRQQRLEDARRMSAAGVIGSPAISQPIGNAAAGGIGTGLGLLNDWWNRPKQSSLTRPY